MSETRIDPNASTFIHVTGATRTGRFRPTTPVSTTWQGSAAGSRHPQPARGGFADDAHREGLAHQHAINQHTAYREAVYQHAKLVRAQHARLHLHSDSTRVFEVVAITGLVTMAAVGLFVAIVMLP